MRFAQTAAKISPSQCRLLAREGNGLGCRPLSYAEIAQRSGLATSTVFKLLNRKSWGDVGIETLDKLMRACGVDPWATKKHRKLVRRGKFAHIDNANASQRRMFGRMLRPQDDVSGAGHQLHGPVKDSNT